MSHRHTRIGIVALVAAAAFPATAPAKSFTTRGFAQMTGAEQLKSIADQTGGGHLAIINGKRYVRNADGRLVRI